MTNIPTVDSVVEEIDKTVNKWELEWLSSACLEELTQILTEDRQTHKQALLDRVEDIGKYDSAACGKCNNCETLVSSCELHIKNHGHAKALEDITDIINELYKD